MVNKNSIGWNRGFTWLRVERVEGGEADKGYMSEGGELVMDSKDDKKGVGE